VLGAVLADAGAGQLHKNECACAYMNVHMCVVYMSAHVYLSKQEQVQFVV